MSCPCYNCNACLIQSFLRPWNPLSYEFIGGCSGDSWERCYRVKELEKCEIDPNRLRGLSKKEISERINQEHQH